MVAEMVEADLDRQRAHAAGPAPRQRAPPGPDMTPRRILVTGAGGFVGVPPGAPRWAAPFPTPH